MTPHELMIPRVIVKADYPDSRFKTAEILQLELQPYASSPIQKYGYRLPYHDYFWDLEHFNKYPHLFRQLYWFEYRHKEHLSHYLKFNDNTYWKVVQWNDSVTGSAYPKFQTPVNWDFWGKHSIPITEEEYDQAFIENLPRNLESPSRAEQ